MPLMVNILKITNRQSIGITLAGMPRMAIFAFFINPVWIHAAPIPCSHDCLPASSYAFYLFIGSAKPPKGFYADFPPRSRRGSGSCRRAFRSVFSQ
jgi:hypothetical protein